MFLVTLGQLYGFEGTMGEAIFIVGFGGLLLIGLLMLKINLRQLIIAGMLMAAALTPAVDKTRMEYIRTWVSPLQERRSELYLAFGVLLTIVVLTRKSVETRLVPLQSVMFLFMAIYAGMLQMVHEDPWSGGQTILYALATIPCLIIAAPALADTYEGSFQFVRSMMWVSIIWTFLCSVQFVLDPSKLVTTGGRFVGVLGNPQQVAIWCAPLAVISMWLLLHDQQRRIKVLWLALTIINLLFLLWSASRTGALMFILGATVVLYRRIGKAVLFLPLGLLAFVALASLADALQIGANIERLTSLEDTREHVWQQQLVTFIENPVLGVGWNANINSSGSENSYLGALSAYGVFYGGMVMVLFVASFWLCMRLTTGRKRLPVEYQPLVDLFCAFNAVYFAGAFFEGYILARSSTTLTMMLIFAGIGVKLKSLMRGEEHHGEETEHTEYGEDESHTAAAA